MEQSAQPPPPGTLPEAHVSGAPRKRGLPSAECLDAGSQHLGHLHACYGAGDLALFLGAGLSLSAGLPDWEERLYRLTVEMWQDRLGAHAANGDAEICARLFTQAYGGFPIISGRYIRQTLGGRFQERIRAMLYSRPDPTSDLLQAVARFARPAGGGGANAVVCYNYDDLVEVHLARESVHHRSIWAEGQAPPPDALSVYHVHGYLPRDGSLDHESEIVFAEDAYHTQFLDPYGWANITQLNLLRERTGLFVGLSMTDPNLRRLLDVAHRHGPDRRHYVILKSTGRQEIAPEDTEKVDPERLGAFISAFRDIQADALAALGLVVIWVDRFDRIAGLLDQMRTGAHPSTV